MEQQVRNLAKITVTPAQVTALAQGATVQLQAVATYDDKTTEDVTNQVQWSSSDDGVASVSPTGTVTIALDAPKGNVTIVAKLAQQQDKTLLVVGLPGPTSKTPPTTTPSSQSTMRAPTVSARSAARARAPSRFARV